MESAIWVAVISSSGVVVVSAIQWISTRGAAKREKIAREDERRHEATRRAEERADAEKQRAAEHEAALERLRAEADVAAEAERRAIIARTKEANAAVARRFIREAHKVHTLLGRALSTGNLPNMQSWAELGEAHGEVVTAFDSGVSWLAGEVVSAFQQVASGAQPDQLLRNSAQMLDELATKAREACSP